MTTVSAGAGSAAGEAAAAGGPLAAGDPGTAGGAAASVAAGDPGTAGVATASVAAASGASGAVDGRRARGAARRGQIVEATLRLIETGGVAAVRHRAVASEAGVPLAATTYYFATLDDLLVAALTEAARRSAATIRAWAGSLVPGADMAVALCELVARLAGPERRATIAEYELCMAAMRRPALLPLAEGWVELLVDVVRPHMADDLSARVLVAAFDGLLIEALLAVEPPTAERLLPVATRLLAHGGEQDGSAP
jgi:DNA-binding transcriptional regulator YbjK